MRQWAEPLAAQLVQLSLIYCCTASTPARQPLTVKWRREWNYIIFSATALHWASITRHNDYTSSWHANWYKERNAMGGTLYEPFVTLFITSWVNERYHIRDNKYFAKPMVTSSPPQFAWELTRVILEAHNKSSLANFGDENMSITRARCGFIIWSVMGGSWKTLLKYLY